MPGNINFSKFWAFVGRLVPSLSLETMGDQGLPGWKPVDLDQGAWERHDLGSSKPPDCPACGLLRSMVDSVGGRFGVWVPVPQKRAKF